MSATLSLWRENQKFAAERILCTTPEERQKHLVTISWDITWSIDPGAYAEAWTRQIADSIEADIVTMADGLTEQATAWMKQNARWNDVSGNARAGLWSDIEHVTRQSVTLLLSHDVTLDYTWFLEANPKTALLGGAADHLWPLLLRGAMEIVRKYSS